MGWLLSRLKTYSNQLFHLFPGCEFLLLFPSLLLSVFVFLFLIFPYNISNASNTKKTSQPLDKYHKESLTPRRYLLAKCSYWANKHHKQYSSSQPSPDWYSYCLLWLGCWWLLSVMVAIAFPLHLEFLKAFLFIALLLVFLKVFLVFPLLLIFLLLLFLPLYWQFLQSFSIAKVVLLSFSLFILLFRQIPDPFC